MTGVPAESADGVPALAAVLPYGVQPRPCRTCPWRCDTAGRVEYANLSEYAAGTIPGDPGFGEGEPEDPHAPLGLLFACHSTAEAGTDTLCAGHLAVVGGDHPLVRLAVAMELLDPAVLTPGPDWPDLHATYADMIAAAETLRD